MTQIFLILLVAVSGLIGYALGKNKGYEQGLFDGIDEAKSKIKEKLQNELNDILHERINDEDFKEKIKKSSGSLAIHEGHLEILMKAREKHGHELACNHVDVIPDDCPLTIEDILGQMEKQHNLNDLLTGKVKSAIGCISKANNINVDVKKENAED